jgi:hypothetical protein
VIGFPPGFTLDLIDPVALDGVGFPDRISRIDRSSHIGYAAKARKHCI